MQSENTTIYKGIAVFMAVAFLILGARFMDNGALNYARDGVGYYRYDKLDNEYYHKQVPLFNSRGEYEKILLNGGRCRVERLLCDLNATTLKSETVNGLTVIYARSPYLSKAVALSFGQVNIMIAYDGDKVTVGTPLIKGSY